MRTIQTNFGQRTIFCLVFAFGCDQSGGIQATPPFLAASAEEVEFGERKVGTSEERTIYLINKGSSPLKLELPEGDTGGGIFAVLLDDFTIPANKHVIARVRFAPADPTRYVTFFTISNNSANEPELGLRVSGTGTRAHPCDGVDCSAAPEPACISQSTSRHYEPMGTCEEETGDCLHNYTDDICDFGCDDTTGACRGDPCTGQGCNTPPSSCYFAQGICENGGCVYTPNNNGTCDDNNPCTMGDHCEEGNCVGDPIVCDTPPQAFCLDSQNRRFWNPQGVCNPGSGACEYTQQDQYCEFGCTPQGCDGDPCVGLNCNTPPSTQCYDQTGTCNGGVCNYGLVPGACDDGDGCTLNDTCNAGNCTGQPMTCNTAPPNECASGDTLKVFQNAGSCTNGACDYPFNAISCNDNNACTTDDYCDSGTCHSGTPQNCDDGNPCTNDWCDPLTGCRRDPLTGPSCVSSSSDCPIGQCVSGSCIPVPNVTCTTEIDVDLCQDIDVAGVCSANGECVVSEAPPGFTCPGCAGICLQCYFFQFCWEF